MLKIHYEIKAHLPLVVGNIQLTDSSAIECVVTCCHEDDNMFIDRITVDNCAGTGWVCWEWSEVRKPDNPKAWVGFFLFAAAYADKQLLSDFQEEVLRVGGAVS